MPKQLSYYLTFFVMGLSFVPKVALAMDPCRMALDLSDEASRAQVILGVGNKNFELATSSGLSLIGHEQTEYERRINFKTESAISAVVVNLLDKFYLFTVKPRSGLHPLFETNLSLRPLATTDADHYHLNGNSAKKNEELAAKLKSGGLTQELLSNEKIILMGASDGDGNAVIKKYSVGRQSEVSIYFDTADSELQKRNIAVRLKTWYPFNVDGSVSSQSTGRSLFIKVMGSTSDLFTERKEVTIAIEGNMSEEHIFETIQMMLKREGISNLKGKLQKIIRIENVRYGVDLAWRTRLYSENYTFGSTQYVRWLQEHKKIGFLVIDRYTATNLLNGKVAAPVTQMEFEIFPEERSLYEANKQNFFKFFEAIEKHVQGVLEIRPKYIQGLEDTKT